MSETAGSRQPSSAQSTVCVPPGDNVWDGDPPSRLGQVLKRVLDVTVATASLIILAPLIVYILLRLKNEEGRPLFVQRRIGKNGKPFLMYKFRTMIPDAEMQRQRMRSLTNCGRLFKVRNDPRVTRFGRSLRRHDLDEIPQLVNVLKGEMSMVGPRPPLAEEAANYEERDRLRLSVKPGITGLWQVDRNRQWVFEQMVDLDIRYVRDWSLLLDLKILLQTPLAVLKGRSFDA